MDQIRAPAVAGAFYPADPGLLQAQLSGLLQSVPPPAAGPRPKALIAPHAGYIYSGPTAAHAYTLLGPYRSAYTRVILLGPAHRARVHGLALSGARAFATPLGEVELDREAMAKVAGLPPVEISDEAHALEHSLEVHLPFLQRTLAGFKLVPIAVGGATPAQVAEVLRALWGGDETLILVSSDLSHYLPYPQARNMDDGTARRILALEPKLNHEQACGATPVNGLLLEAARRGMTPQLLDLRNSGDTAGDKDRVVGYASFAFFDQPAGGEVRDAVEGGPLILLARAAIAGHFGWQYAADSKAPFLDRAGACFVTLTRDGALRGCIGSLQAHRSLREDVRANALAAALHDPRFEPLTFEELRQVRIEVSVLSALEPLAFGSEAQALAQLRPGVDGLVLEHGSKRATYLPQVWDQLPTPQRFLGELKRKAGLAADFWDRDIRLSRYHVDKWIEPEQ